MKQTTTQLKRSRLIEKALNEIFQQNGFSLGLKGIVTVMHARVSPDLRSAKIYLTFWGFDRSDEKVRNSIAFQGRSIQKLLWSKLRSKLRRLPELTFFVDDTEREARRIEELLAKLNP